MHPKPVTYTSIFPKVFKCRAGLLLAAVFFFLGCRQNAKPSLFSEQAPPETGIDFVNRLPEQTPGGMNIIQYLYYYNGGGVAAGDVNNDGLVDLYFSANLEPNRLYLNKGNFRFEDITEKAGVGGAGNWKTGVTMADVNADGWLDIYVCQVGQYKTFSGKNQLFVNNRDGTFTERAAEYGLALSAFCTQAAFFDYDLDGDLDCFLLCHSVHSAGTYRDTSLTRKFDPLAADRLLRNDSKTGQTPAFTDVSVQAGIYGGTAGYGLGLAIGDLNADGFPDIYVGNDFHENDYLYYNQNGRFFEENIAGSMGHTSNFSMGCDLADMNNDGRPDLVSLDMKPEAETTLKASAPADAYDIYLYKHSLGYHWQFPRNTLQINTYTKPGNNRPTSVFSEIAQFAGIAATDWSWSALLADYDLDGQKDLYITNGIVRRPNDMDYLKFTSSAEVQRQATDLQLVEKMPPGQMPNYCYRNTGDLHFEDVSEAWGLNHKGCSNGAVYADLDNDGDLDLISNNLNEPASVFQNNTAGAHWLKVQFLGEAPNTFGIGATLTVWAGGQMQYFENQPVRGFQSAVAPGLLTIGLGASPAADSLLVRWPDGRRTRLQQPASGQTLALKQSEARPATNMPRPAGRPLFQLLDLPAVKHRENEFKDNTREKLIPWFLSTQGPKLAVGDVDGDGRADFYLPQQSPGRLMRQTGSSIFVEIPMPDTGIPAGAEETVAAFLDADNDGDLDLYLGTGGNEFLGKSPELLDRLLLNNGKGRFSAALTALPEMFENTACARPGDFDGDGDTDLFVGGRSVAGAYGIAPNSFLLENDGKGHFFDATAKAPGLARAGMVTDAQWTDVDGDGRPDLVLAGEWMPLTVFRNTRAGFFKFEIPLSAGLWNALAVSDLDGDGDTDLLAGNLGLNSILRATPGEPLGLWVKDFDRNGSFDPVLTYFRQGKNCIFADKDLLMNQLPGLRKNYVGYRHYAESTFDDVFPPKLRDGAIHFEAQTLASCWVENSGQGQWVLHALPAAAQWSPVFALLPGDFDGDGKPDVLCGGNFYEVQPAIGRFDAGHGVFLRGDGKGGFTTLDAAGSGFWPEGAVRDLQHLGARVLVGVNGGDMQVFSGAGQ